MRQGVYYYSFHNIKQGYVSLKCHKHETHFVFTFSTLVHTVQSL